MTKFRILKTHLFLGFCMYMMTLKRLCDRVQTTIITVCIYSTTSCVLSRASPTLKINCQHQVQSMQSRGEVPQNQSSFIRKFNANVGFFEIIILDSIHPDYTQQTCMVTNILTYKHYMYFEFDLHLPWLEASFFIYCIILQFASLTEVPV